jgi:DNA topoisomerase-1
VQSVALRLICERESEIEAFDPQEYWSLASEFTTPKGDKFTARLSRLDGEKLDKFSLGNAADAKRAVALIEAQDFKVQSIEKKKAQRHPSPPFSTSTLQQEAARKLGFGTDRTMRTAQRLFEGIKLDGETVGLITYMRTDSVQLSADALAACRAQIKTSYGGPFLPDQPRTYKTKTKNAQEAHEAIRPTDLGHTPDRIGRFLDDDQRRLYDLIWKRTMASQMSSAQLDRVIAELTSGDDKVGFRANGSTVTFPGFLKIYQEGRDDPAQDDDDADGLLPPMAPNDPLDRGAVEPKQHFTEPPPRYSEASLVKKLEELGIGRPSTYASIISVLQNRNYVRLESRRFIPEDRGRLVTAFLTAFFDQYVQPDFTALLENRLDEVASGALAWKSVLRDFWDPFHSVVDEVKERRVADVIDALNDLLAPRLFPPRPDGSDPRSCQLCEDGRLSLKLGRYGAFVGCSNYPECRFTRKLDADPNQPEPEEQKERIIGVDPTTSEEVILKHGPYGPYVQRGAGDDLKRSSLAPNMTPADLTLDQALSLLALPREIGKHPESDKPIEAGINRYGPYIKHDRFVRLGADDDVLTIGMNRAISLIAEAATKKGPTQKVLRELGEHPEDQKPVTLHEGRFGPYVKHGKINASLPKAEAPESLTMATAVALLAAKAAKGGAKKGAKRPTKKKAAKGKGAKP